VVLLGEDAAAGVVLHRSPIALSIVLALLLHEHEVQMILMRDLVDAGGLELHGVQSARDASNLTLPSGRVIPAPVFDDRQAARCGHRVEQATAIWGSLFISLFIAVPLSAWFVDLSRRRGKAILEERHQRGAMLVDAAELAAVINQHNSAALAQEIAERMPGKTMADVDENELRRAQGSRHPPRLPRHRRRAVPLAGASRLTRS